MFHPFKRISRTDSNAVFDALKDIEAQLPFPILGYDADNGGEVLNHHILAYFGDDRVARGLAPVQVTRAREYRKNDNAHVERELKAKLIAEHRSLNPVALVREERALRKLIDLAARRLAQGLAMPAHPTYTLSKPKWQTLAA